MWLESMKGWIQVTLEPAKEKSEEVSLIALPEDYRVPEDPYKVVTVVASSGIYSRGEALVVPTHVIREVKVRGATFYLIENSHVMAKVFGDAQP